MSKRTFLYRSKKMLFACFSIAVGAAVVAKKYCVLDVQPPVEDQSDKINAPSSDQLRLPRTPPVENAAQSQLQIVAELPKVESRYTYINSFEKPQNIVSDYIILSPNGSSLIVGECKSMKKDVYRTCTNEIAFQTYTTNQRHLLEKSVQGTWTERDLFGNRFCVTSSARPAFSKRGDLLAKTGDHRASLWKRAAGSLRPYFDVITRGFPVKLLFSPDGSKAFVAETSGLIHGVSMDSLSSVEQVSMQVHDSGSEDPLFSTHISPNGARMAACLYQKSPWRLFDTKSGQQLFELDHNRYVYCIDESRILITGDTRIRVLRIDNQGKECVEVESCSRDSLCSSLVWGHATFNQDKTHCLINDYIMNFKPDKPCLTALLSCQGILSRLIPFALTSHGNYLITRVHSLSHSVLYVESLQGENAQKKESMGPLYGSKVICSSDEKYVVAHEPEKTAMLLSLASGKQYTFPIKSVHSVFFNPWGDVVVSGCDEKKNKKIAVYDAQLEELKESIPGSLQSVSDDGSTFVVDADKLLKVYRWEKKEGE